jgi:hypothetical protein
VTEQYEEQFARFNNDVKGHSVQVLRDDGLYRHLRCSEGSRYCMSFDVVTWPGYLCYAGDMGCFVFTRLRDMFEFFRGRQEAMIDRGYLAQKAVAADKPDGIREYSEERFRAAVKADYGSYVESEELSPQSAADLWECITDEVLSRGDNRHDAVNAAMDFEWTPSRGSRPRAVFSDFWEHRLDEYTTRFWWCCYAIPWAIAQYDAAKAPCQSDALARSDDAVVPVVERVTD